MTRSDPAERLRKQFDESFALPRRTATTDAVLLARVQTSAGAWFVRVGDLHVMVAAGRVTPFPHSPPGLLGCGSVRSVLLSVWDLGSLMDAGSAVTPSRHWLIPRVAPTLALAVRDVQSTTSVPSTRLGPGSGGFADVPVQTGDDRTGVLDIDEVVRAIRSRIDRLAAASPHEERR